MQPELPARGSAILRLFGRTTFWLWLDSGLLSVGSMIAGLLLVRYLGPADYGLFSLALATGALVGLIVDFGLTQYAAREIAARPQHGRTILSIALAVSLAMVSTASAGLLLAARQEMYQVAAVLAGLILGSLDRLSELTAAFLCAELRSREQFYGSLLLRGGRIGVFALAIWKNFTVMELLLAICVAALPVNVLRFWQVRHHWPGRENWRWAAVKEIIAPAWPFYSSTLTYAAHSRILVVCLGLASSRKEVGWFGAGLVMASLFPVYWASPVSQALLPLMTRLYQAQRIKELVQLRQRLLDVLCIIVIPVAVILAVFGTELCRLLGAQYAPSGIVVQILSPQCLFWTLDGFLGWAFLTATNNVRARQKVLAFSLVVLALLTLLLGRVWGATGAAMASVVAGAVTLAGYFKACQSIGMKVHLGRTVRASLLAGLVMAFGGLELVPLIGWVSTLASVLLVYIAVLLVVARSGLRGATQTVRICFGGA